MRLQSLLLVPVVFIPALGGISQAATLSSLPIIVGDGTGTEPMESLLCLVFNASQQPILIEKIEPLDREGNIAGFVPEPFLLQPGQTGSGGLAVGANNPAVCRFTFQGARSQVRASACLVRTFTDSVRNYCLDAR